MASESTIYGRFGFGPASEAERVVLAARRVRFAHQPPVRSLRLVPKEEAAPVLAPCYDVVRARSPGWVTRSRAWWAAILGDERSWKGGGPVWVAVADPDPDSGDPGGYVIYERVPLGGGPHQRLEVRELVATDAGCEAALWRYCLELDLIEEVVATRPLDDPLRWWLADSRQVRVLHRQDELWVRILDVAAALAARRYRHDGVLVLDVEDAFRPSGSGRYRLTVDGGEAACERLPEGAGPGVDLRLGIAELGAMLLGGVSATTLARAHRIGECRPGAVALADALFGADRLPSCPTRF
jgi:predicted acetyltransferase